MKIALDYSDFFIGKMTIAKQISHNRLHIGYLELKQPIILAAPLSVSFFNLVIYA